MSHILVIFFASLFQASCQKSLIKFALYFRGCEVRVGINVPRAMEGGGSYHRHIKVNVLLTKERKAKHVIGSTILECTVDLQVELHSLNLEHQLRFFCQKSAALGCKNHRHLKKRTQGKSSDSVFMFSW